MTKTSIQKQEAKLKEITRRIKNEKNRIEQRLGKQIINQANLDYASLSNDQINSLSKKISEFLKQDQAHGQL